MTAPADAPAVAAPEPTHDPPDVLDALRRACDKIAPAWPLENFVTVNPYLGLKDQSFEEAADTLAKTAGVRTTLSASYYLDAFEAGRITKDDLAAALEAREAPPAKTADALLEQLYTDGDETDPFAAEVPTVADVAFAETGRDWDRLVTDQVSSWAGAYFDRGQALWPSADDTQPLFTAWKEEACVDRTPDVMGLDGFRDAVAGLPDDPREAARTALATLDVPKDGLDLYLHRVLRRVGGWASFAARIVWNRKRYADEEDDTLLQFLTVLLCWEAALLKTLPSPIDAAWADAKDRLLALSHSSERSQSLERHLVLQDAFDRAAQRDLVDRVNDHTQPAPSDERPDAQAIFCIDVRSEVLRRHLESVASSVDTLGFAGFFGIPIEYVPMGHEEGGTQCPPLLTPEHTILEKMPDEEDHETAVWGRRLKQHVKRAWNAFKMGAVSCFSFVGPIGLAYLPKMITDTLGWTRTVPDPDTMGLDDRTVEEKAPSLTPNDHDDGTVGMPIEDQIDTAEEMLQAMSLTEDFAHLVMITGHEATTVNNPYDSGLDCGACSGHSGGPNAQVAATILNNDTVRMGLADRGIDIPTDTFFLAATHNTTTDEVTVLNRDEVPERHRDRLQDLEDALAEAGRRTRRERAERFHLPDDADVDTAVTERSTDWSQVRPEWGLAGCHSFIVAPRRRTEQLDLEGRSFLHNYDWRQDEDFSVLELIMTAPMVVTSWISLQYYASTVDNEHFGSGNKTLHNVVGKLGVLEGNAGDLRVGLPWQSVHDGDSYQHEPLRLNVVIEAPREAMNDVLERHDDVRALCDNGWLRLLAMEKGTVTHRYTGNLTWTPVDA